MLIYLLVGLFGMFDSIALTEQRLRNHNRKRKLERYKDHKMIGQSQILNQTYSSQLNEMIFRNVSFKFCTV